MLQKVFVIAMVAITCGVIVLFALADRETALEMSARQQVIVTREVELQPFANNTPSETKVAHANLNVSQQKNPAEI
jgi:hypothetical protein